MPELSERARLCLWGSPPGWWHGVPAGWGLLLPPVLGTPQAAGGGRAPAGVPGLTPAPRLPAGSRSTSTRTASCPTRRTSWPCRWAARGHPGDPRGPPTGGAGHHQRVWGRSAERGPRCAPVPSWTGASGGSLPREGGAGLVPVPRAHGLAAQPGASALLLLAGPAPPRIFRATEAPLCRAGRQERAAPGREEAAGWLPAGRRLRAPRAVPAGPASAPVPASPCAPGTPKTGGDGGRVPADVAGRAGEALQDAERADRPVPAAQPGAGLHPALRRREGEGEGERGGQGLLGYTGRPL